MQKFLETPTTSVLGKAANIGLGFILIILWSLLMGELLYDYADIEVFSLFSTVILYPIAEEIFYRHLPFQIIKSFKLQKILIPTILFTSVVFGEAHELGVESIPLQGVMGLVLAGVYIKNGYSLWSSFILHALWNLTCCFNIL